VVERLSYTQVVASSNLAPPIPFLWLLRAGFAFRGEANRLDAPYFVPYPCLFQIVFPTRPSDRLCLPLAVLFKRLIDLPRRVLLVSLQDMPIGSQRQHRRRVSQHILNDLHARAARKHQSRR
jgi:hypothetical protein